MTGSGKGQDEMCNSDDLDNELADGTVYAERLAEHLIKMGAAQATIKAEIGGENFIVTVRREKESDTTN